MKKKIFAAVLAVLTAASMAACGNEEAGGNDVNDVPDVTVSEKTAKADPETEASTEKPVETVPETETEAETEAETESADGNASAAGDVYKGTGYTITIDTEKWADASEYIRLIGEYSAELDLGMELSAEEIESMSDGIFFRTNMSGTNFNIVCNEIGDLGADFDISMFAGLMEEQYTAAGITYLGDEVIKHNGKNWLKVNVETDRSGADMKMLQYMALNGANQYVITYTADKDNYDKSLSEFEAVFNSFEFTD